MANVNSTDTEQLKEASQTFLRSSVDLVSILDKAKIEVGTITEGGLKGKARDKLVDTFDALETELRKYPPKLEQIGKSLKTSAENSEAIDDAAEKAATINM